MGLKQVQPQFQVPKKPRIIIEIVDIVKGASVLKVEGGLTPMGIAMVLTSQLNVLLPNMFSEMIQNASGLTDAKGKPILNMPIIPTSETLPVNESEMMQPFDEQVQP